MLLHVAPSADWPPPGDAYAPASLATEGFVHCSTPAQVAKVATAVFRGRTDLVLLCIDPAALTSEVRFEAPAHVAGADVPDVASTETFPHVYGPIDVAAVVDVMPFPPEADGRFFPPLDLRLRVGTSPPSVDGVLARAADVMKGYRGRWWVGGGWAIDGRLRTPTRFHHDIDIVTVRSDADDLWAHLVATGKDVRIAEPGRFEEWRGRPLRADESCLWVRDDDGRRPDWPEFAMDPTDFEVLLETTDGDTWHYRRDHRVSAPIERLGEPGGLLAPEVALLYKSPHPDGYPAAHDADVGLPLLDAEAQGWLREALATIRPNHPWLPRLHH